MHLFAFNRFIAILVPKLVAIITLLCPLCTEVSQMNSSTAQTLFHNQTLHGCVAYNSSYGHFCDILAYFGQNFLPWQRLLDPCNQKCLLWIVWPRKPLFISNRTIVVYRRSAVICIYSSFSPKIDWRGNAPLSLVYGSVTDEFPDSTNPISKPNSAWMCRLQLMSWPFLWFYGLFWPKFGCHGNFP